MAQETTAGEQSSSPAAERDPNAVYQNSRMVARVEGAEVDAEAREVRFAELYQSDYLLLPDECEFREYRMIVRKIAFATKVERGAAERGRILRTVTAEILGYREQ